MYLAIMAFAWGKGETETAALAQMRKAAGQSIDRETYNVYQVGPTARVNEDGGLVYQPAKDTAPVLVRKVVKGKTVDSRLYDGTC